MSGELNRPLQVVGFIGTRPGDPERGPLIRMNAQEAGRRMLIDGELVRIAGPRRTEFAQLQVDDSIPRGSAVLRDVAGASASELIRVYKPDLDSEKPRSGQLLA